MRAQILFIVVIVFWTGATAHDVIVRQNVRIHDRPNSASPTLFTLLPGDEARLLEMEPENGYLHVFHRQGNGWAFARRVDVLPDYERTEYRHWIDEDEDRCDTRAEVLIQESEILVTLEENKPCKVIAGRWTDPYSGEVIADASEMDVDHMVPLRNAHRSGAWRWTYERRRSYANDLTHPEHLIAVKASLNRSKGAKGPEEWRPPNISYHCQYAIDWESIKHRWGLTMSQAEEIALAEMRTNCP